MSGQITAGEDILAADFINESEKNGTPSNDAGRVPKLETDAKVSRAFSHHNQKYSLLAGENITGATTPQACFIMSEQRINRFKLAVTSFNSTEDDFEVYNNGAGTDNRMGYRFSSGTNDYLKGVAFEGASEGNLAGHSYIVEVFAVDGSGHPTGVALGSQAFTSAQFVSSSAASHSYWYIEFSSIISLTQATNYIMTFRETTTTGSSTVNLHIYMNSGADITSRYSTNGSTWSTGYPGQGTGGVANIILYGNVTQTVGRVYLSDGNDADRNYFDGFVAETDTAGNSVDLFHGTDVPGFTSLLPGSDYYLDTTPGAVTTTRAKGKKIGTAKSTTSISPNYRPELSDGYYSQAASEYDFEDGLVPFVSDGMFEWVGTQEDQIYITASDKFHEAMFGLEDKTFQTINPVTNQYLMGTSFFKQKQYVRTQLNSSAVIGSYVIRYQL